MFYDNVDFHRTYNATAILLQLPSFDALLHNYRCSFSMQWSCVDNAVYIYIDILIVVECVCLVVYCIIVVWFFLLVDMFYPTYITRL